MDYSYYDSVTAGMFGGLAIFGIIILLIVLVALIFGTIGLWKIYKKAGKHGWEAIVPFYGYWVLVEIAGLNWWWFLLVISDSIVSLIGLDDLEGIVALVSLFASFNCYYNIAKKFNKGVGYAIGLTLLTPIFAPILGFSKNDMYDKNVVVSENGCIGTPGSSNNNNYTQSQSNDTNSYDGNVTDGNGIQQVKESSFCGNCGTKMSKDTRFCPNCGKENL